MRLINIKTYQLEIFDNWDTTPPYAILSHTWEQEEVLFHDITTDADDMKKKRGWGKILGASVEAQKLGIFYLWVDTCCIDKTSSAELSQSINSMFAWYRDAMICLAYLGDFNGDDVKTFDKSRWWTRGWTLQELIAPVEVMFFAQDWTFVALRSSSNEQIAWITGIAVVILAGDHLTELHKFSVAEKFSWAAKRMTTRIEDRAYSLMGIFGVNMAMIYGEGEQAAFYRLQKEIFAVYPDHSIFAWDLNSQYLRRHWRQKTYDLFAPTISAFDSSSDIICEPYDWDLIGAPKASKPKAGSNNNKQLSTFSSFCHGIRVQMLLEGTSGDHFLAYLACRRRDRDQTSLRISLLLDRRSGQYQRFYDPKANYEIDIDSTTGYRTKLEDVYIAQPRLDFAFSSRPARYQLGVASDVPEPKLLLFLEDESARQAGFTFETPPDPRWQQPAGQPHVRAGAGFPLREVYRSREHVVVYRHEKTNENFAIFIRIVGEILYPAPPRQFAFMITIMINAVKTPLTSERERLECLYGHDLPHGSLIDLFRRMVIMPLPSGKQVILGVHTFAVGMDIGFMLTVIVKEPKI